ncbi:hypothetical protein V3C99_008388 [Haemonchus contortus]|uniref:Protein TAG-261, isoform b n=1 Tax=Haemonchus contortus TaxID=6289 RepID=W6NHE9_HAECO
MSSNVGLQLDEIAKYIDRMKEQKRSTEKCIADIEKDRTGLEERIEEMKRKRDELDERLRVEQERLLRQERTIRQGEATYAKLMDSSQSLVDFMKKEYQDTRRQ